MMYRSKRCVPPRAWMRARCSTTRLTQRCRHSRCGTTGLNWSSCLPRRTTSSSFSRHCHPDVLGGPCAATLSCERPRRRGSYRDCDARRPSRKPSLGFDEGDTRVGAVASSRTARELAAMRGERGSGLDRTTALGDSIPWHVVHVRALPDQRLHVEFADGTSGVAHLGPLIRSAHAGPRST